MDGGRVVLRISRSPNGLIKTLITQRHLKTEIRITTEMKLKRCRVKVKVKFRQREGEKGPRKSSRKPNNPMKAEL